MFVVAEDSRFYSHSGIDYEAIKNAIVYNLTSSNRMLGASTISQQTVKNMFLSLSRNPLRKWHEYVLTRAMEQSLSKDRILDIYLNIAEMGKNIFGLEAAARFYFGRSALYLSEDQAIELAASLPSPKKDNPSTRSRAFKRRKAKITRNWRVGHPKPKLEPNNQALLPSLEELNKEHQKDQNDLLDQFPTVDP